MIFTTEYTQIAASLSCKNPKNWKMIGLLPFWELIFLVIQHCVPAYSWPPMLQFDDIGVGIA
jgi:hypothetical protein